jgi:hypothetical protein
MDNEREVIKDLVALVDELTGILEREAPHTLTEDLAVRGAQLMERAGSFT